MFSYVFPFAGDTGVVHLATALESNTGLETLLLADNPFGDEGGTTLRQTLCSHNKTLKTLDVHQTQMSRSGEKLVEIANEP